MVIILDGASNGLEALELFKQNKYSLLILDVMMPKMDGWSVCREIRKTSHVPIIMLTARGEEIDITNRIKQVTVRILAADLGLQL